LSRRRPELLDVAVPELRATNASLAERGVESWAYRVRFTTNADYSVETDLGVPVGTGKLGAPFSGGGVTLTLGEGTARRPKPGAVYDLKVESLEHAADRVLKVLKVSSPKGATLGDPVNVITLEFTDRSPYLAATLLDQLMVAYLKERQSWKTEDATAAEAFVTEQLTNVKKQLERVQQKLAEYRSGHRTVVLDDGAKAMVEQIAKYEEQRLGARLQVAAFGDIHRVLKDANAPVGAYLLGEADDRVLEGMASSLSEARQKLTDLDTRFNAAAPEMRLQKAQVDAQLETLRGYVASRAQRARDNLGTLNTIIGQFEERLKAVPADELGLAELTRESEVYNRTYSYLLERQQQAGIVKASTLSKNRILDAPELPTRESSPVLLWRIASLFVGLLVGLAVVVGRSFVTGAFQSESDVRKTAAPLHVVAAIPAARARSRRRGQEGDELPALDVPAGTPESRFVEAFRALRAELHALRSLGEGRVVLITSPQDGDGKTTCALWLAAVLAAEGRRVLVLDANLRHPASDGAPGARAGLGAVLTGERTFAGVVRRVRAAFGSFDLIGRGDSASPELLGGDGWNALLDHVKAAYDVVLLDAPSFPCVADALSLTTRADVVLSVVGVENTSRRLAREHWSRLVAVSRALYVVVNLGAKGPSRAPSLVLPVGERTETGATITVLAEFERQLANA
ncbi:MAG TPA: GNVR domain-containing protein, partial [Polyangiaceae bacterium]|nr:GNVR domain-containing protein [Polyangiaceae bacterium]